MTPSPLDDAKEWPPIVDAIIYKVRDCGERGQLDEYLLGIKGQSLEETASEISATVPPRVAEGALVAQRVLATVRTFVRTHPFRDEGGYFGELSAAAPE